MTQILLPTDLRKATTYEIVRVLSSHIYDNAMADLTDELWDTMRQLIDELEYRVTTEVQGSHGAARTAKLN